jgi:hypothetical protein
MHLRNRNRGGRHGRRIVIGADLAVDRRRRQGGAQRHHSPAATETPVARATAHAASQTEIGCVIAAAASSSASSKGSRCWIANTNMDWCHFVPRQQFSEHSYWKWHFRIAQIY